MSELMIVVIILLVAGGFFCLGAMWQIRHVSFWRIEWIKLEHDLARAEGRKPRKIDDYVSNVKDSQEDDSNG